MDIDDTLLSSNSVMDGRFEGLLNQQLQTRHEEIQRKKDEVNAMHARVKKEARLVKEMEERLLYATRNLDVAKKDADATADGMRNRVLQENIRCAQVRSVRDLSFSASKLSLPPFVVFMFLPLLFVLLSPSSSLFLSLSLSLSLCF